MNYSLYISIILTASMSVALSSGAQTVRQKEIAVETGCNSGATVTITNIPYELVIKTSKHDKVKFVTTVHFQGESELTEKEWADKKGITLNKTDENNISFTRIAPQLAPRVVQGYALRSPSNTIVNFGQLSFGTASSIRGKGRPDIIFDSAGNATLRRTAAAEKVTLYIPAGSKLDIKNALMDITIESGLKSMQATINNTSLIMKDATQATISAMYGRVSTGDLKTADLKVVNGRLIAGSIDNLKINSRSSDIEIAAVREMVLQSSNDQYEIDEVDNISGSKQYGTLRLGLIKNSLSLEGTNADVRVRNIKAAAALIRINNKYADIRLPVSRLENYLIDYDGSFSNIYAPFNTSSNKFAAIVGDPQKSATSFVLRCNNCTIDFR